MTRRLAAALIALAGCSTRAAPSGQDTPADHIAAAANAPRGMHADHLPGTRPEDAAMIELATVTLALDDAEQALQQATARRAPAEQVEALQRKIADLRARQDRLRDADGAMARTLAHPPQPIAR